MSDDLPALISPSQPLATLADAESALKTIAVAEAAETLWARAKDATRMHEAIHVKLTNQAAYAVFRASVAKHGFGPGRGHKEISDTQSLLPAIDPGVMVIHRWRERLCRKPAPNVWEVDEAKLSAALADAKHRCVRICEQEKTGTIRGTEGTGEFERYTPARYVEAARNALGRIDLDPASSDLAQQTVQAKSYFTAEDDGLARNWLGRVWLNPPYHRELAPKFIAKLLSELANGHITEAVVLTNNSTDTEWFRLAANVCNAICFTSGRIHFDVPNAAPVMPTQGQAFFYFGPDVAKFAYAYREIGYCLQPVR